MRLFHNPKQHAYLRELSDEFGLAPSQVREELKQLNRKMDDRSSTAPTLIIPSFLNYIPWSERPSAWTIFWKAL
jgi:hypothetical protein